jgi:hypothetical protein
MRLTRRRFHRASCPPLERLEDRVQPAGPGLVSGLAAGLPPVIVPRAAEMSGAAGDAAAAAAASPAGMITGPQGWATAVFVQPADGKIVTAGIGALARYNPDGTPDSSFGNGGSVGSFGANGVVIQPDGKIVGVSGSTSFKGCTKSQAYAISRRRSIK